MITTEWPTEAVHLQLVAGETPRACTLLCQGEEIEVPFDIAEGALILHPLPWRFDRGLEYAYTFRLSR